MWTTDKTRRANITPRPLRVAYLVPLDPSHTLLDVLFAESMSRWGGRRTPIIITDGSSIATTDWAFLDLWDADVIYSYVPLDDTLREQIAFCLAPATIDVHKTLDDWEDDYALRPRQELLHSALKVTSVLPRLARHQEVRRGKINEVLDREAGSDVARDLADSFGFLSDASIHVNLGLNARRLSYRGAGKEEQAPRFRGDDVISYVSDISDLEERLSKDGALLLPSQMSDMFCPYLNGLSHAASWEDRLTLVIGDEQVDRLLFWNAIHHYKALDVFRSSQIFRFGLPRVQGSLPAWIKYLCGGVRNSRRLGGNGAANVKIISASLPVDMLEAVSNRVGASPGTMSSFARLKGSSFEPFADNDPRKEYQHSMISWPAWLWGGPRNSQSVKIDRNEIDLPCVRPWHTEDFPLGPTTVGSWLCDIDMQRAEDHSRYSNVEHRWIFPRRLALHRGVRMENYGAKTLGLQPPTRPTERGSLSVWEDMQWNRPTLRIPQDINAFRQALFYHHPNSVAEQNQHQAGGPAYRISDISVSGKGRDLLGVLKFFHNLNEAAVFLTNRYILNVISRLAPTDTSQDTRRTKDLTAELARRFKDKAPNDEDFNRAAKRVLELAARWVQKDTKASEYLSYKVLRQILSQTVKKSEEREGLDDCLKFLRNQSFLLQGYGWKCRRCRHPNWVGLEQMANNFECVICAAVEDAPVGGDEDTHFRLNSFVSAAFGPASAQDAVIWCVALLLESANHSFMLTPTLDIRDKANFPKGTDLDVLACVDGKVHLYEVKRSFAGIDQRQIDDLVQIATLLRPDFAGFAVHNDSNKNVMEPGQIQTLKERLQALGVEFVLVSGNNTLQRVGYGGVPRNVGDPMRWTVWNDG
ncbi:hypothetical protein [Pararhizobium sp. PWRC1-1]|uniref:hypothetical protein n=1 Tax=Pararhizobium sp. PWRC1-1 TaxID=2804566 RepID=UPI003CE87913